MDIPYCRPAGGLKCILCYFYLRFLSINILSCFFIDFYIYNYIFFILIFFITILYTAMSNGAVGMAL